MGGLQIIHYAYILIILVIVGALCFKKDIVLLCIIGIGIIGFIYSGNAVKTVQILYKALVVSGKEFIEIVIIISLVNAMSKALKEIGADEIIIGPFKKLMINRETAFLILGVTMLIFSWLIWPTPAVAFIGSIMVPAAVRAGLKPIWCAAALDLFGNGMALSSDFFIQAAPAITAKTARASSPYEIIKASIPIWLVMSIVTIVAAFLIMRKDKAAFIDNVDKTNRNVNKSSNYLIKEKGVRFISVFTAIAFLTVIFLMYRYKIKGADATALIGGTSIIIMCLTTVIHFNFLEAMGKVTGYVKDGFMFGIKVFAPIIIIGAFFFLGSKETASEILGPNAKGILSDIGLYLSCVIPLSKFSAVMMQAGISAMLGIGGSGFAGLPLIGTLAQTFAHSITINKEGIAALGQIITIWVGGGTIIPWSVIPVCAVCDVDPVDLVKKNIIPVICGIIASVIISIILL